MKDGPNLAGLPVAQVKTPCKRTVTARSTVLGREVRLCPSAARRAAQTPGGMTLAGKRGETIMAKKGSCPHGRVKSGPRKGRCRKHARRRAR